MFRIISFYKYTPIDEPAAFCESHLQYCLEHGLKGKVYVASEGINGTITAEDEKVQEYKSYLTSLPGFDGIVFKEDTWHKLPYDKMFVRLKKELVNLGVPGIDPAEGGKRLSPEGLKQFYDEKKDFIIIDTRNGYESELGHFKGAVTPNIVHFRDFPAYIDSLEEYKNKTVITYCTGGIRCEKASALLIKMGFRDVYQLDGGIISYIQKYPDTYWEGGMFVFDNRKVVNTNTKEELKYTARCHHCGAPTDYFINCHNLSCDKIINICHNCKVAYNYSCSEECANAPERRTKIYE
ncbi:MAG: rhodanese-related sulfurtransferase [Ignavibacteriaceae bacterium]|nr:rhodanese-related sulfurtransferase [Ignavibacteriaceae bacterium]